MLAGPKFARVSYTLFSIAILAALIKLGGITGVKPFILRTTPATSVARAAEPVPGESPKGDSLNLPERRYTLGGRLLPGLTSRPDAKDGDAPVFYRPSPAREAGSEEPVCGDLGDFPESSRVVFPLPEAYLNSYEDTWGAARPQGGHEGADLMSPGGTPEFAITDGAIVPVSGANKNGWNRLGGYTVMLEAAYDAGPIKKGDLFYYAHMNEQSTLPIGTKVHAGQQVGVAGDTGEGPEGTRGKFPQHLHLGWYDMDPESDRTSLDSGAMNPYPLLLWLETNGGAVAGGMDAAYCEAPQSPIPKPSTGAESWSASASPSTRPDLDTGDADGARPSPVVEKDRSPEPRSEPEEKKELGKPDGRTGAASKEQNPAGKPEKQAEEAKENRDGPSAAGEDGPTEGEERTSSPPTGDGSSDETRKKDRFSPSNPRPAYASVLADMLRAGTPADRGDPKVSAPSREEERDPPNSPEDKEPEASGPKPTKSEDRPHPGPNKPEKTDDPPASCDPPGKLDEERKVRVTRDRGDGRRAPIGRGEWLALVEKDPEMRACEAKNQASRYKGLAVWTGHPDRDEVRFYLRGGNVVAENPDGPTTEKMREIAGALDARVATDDGAEP